MRHGRTIPPRPTQMRAHIRTLILIAAGCASGCSRPRPPLLTEVAVCDTTGWAHDVIVEHDRVFVADRQGGYAVFNRGRSWASPAVYAPVADVISLAPIDARLLLASRFDGLVETSAASGLSPSTVRLPSASSTVGHRTKSP